MHRPTPLFANDKTAAQLFDMKLAEFLSMVDAGHLPKAKEIAGIKRWDVEELRRIARGETADGIGGIDW